MMNRAWLLLTLGMFTPMAGCQQAPPETRSAGEACVATSECESNLCYVSTCLEPERDDDGDGLTNTLESQLGTDPFAFDSDGDGLSDLQEIPYLAEPADEDGDGVIDAIESLVAETGSEGADADKDCLPDQKDPDNASPSADAHDVRNRACCCYGPCDKFGSTGEEGQERLVPGAGETITVLSANACTEEVLESGDLGCVLSHEWVNGDDDNDGVDNACDPCRAADWQPDPETVDPDYPNDSDRDSVWDCEDNCPPVVGQDTANPPNPYTGLQADLDGDGQGDACDEDRDGDGILNTEDNCPDTPNPAQIDLWPANDIGDACDPLTFDPDLDDDGALNWDDCAPEDGQYQAKSCVEGAQCGDDGCGGVCGTCKEDEACEGSLCVALCAPACEDKACGDDGCGGSCGECSEGSLCSDGGACEAVCTPSCVEGAQCGDDGCGGSCGECGEDAACDSGQCISTCAPQCEDKECGDDGCGGSCGGCDDGDICTEDVCSGLGLCVFAPISCDDGDPCTLDTCDIAEGCVYDAGAAEGQPCDDGVGSTQGDVCVDGLCAGTLSGETCEHPLLMGDGETLEIDTCQFKAQDLLSGCGIVGPEAVVRVDIPYEKALLILEVIDGPEQLIVEGVGNASCTGDFGGTLCKSVGASYQIDAYQSDVANTFRFGTSDDTCGPVTLSLTLACACDDQNPCTSDLCGEEGLCEHEASPLGAACDDGDACTQGDACREGSLCVGEPLPCSDGDPCTFDGCQAGGEGALCVSQGTEELCGPADDDPCTARVCDVEGATSAFDSEPESVEALCAEVVVTQGAVETLITHAEAQGCACVPEAPTAVASVASEAFCSEVCATLTDCGVESCVDECVAEVSADHRAARAWSCQRERHAHLEVACDPTVYAAERAACDATCYRSAPSLCESSCQRIAETCWEVLDADLPKSFQAYTLSQPLCRAACAGGLEVDLFAGHDFQCIVEHIDQALVVAGDPTACIAPVDFSCGARPCDVSQPSCLLWSTTLGGNGHYYLVDEKAQGEWTWSEARSSARAATLGDDRPRYGGHLALPSTAEEDTWLREAYAQVLEGGAGAAWIGVYVPVGLQAPEGIANGDDGAELRTLTGEPLALNQELLAIDSVGVAAHFASYRLKGEGAESEVGLEFRQHGAPVSRLIIEYEPTWGVCSDRDHDGVCNTDDICPSVADAEQADADEDGFGDACDVAPGKGEPSFLSQQFTNMLSSDLELIDAVCALHCETLIDHCGLEEGLSACTEGCVADLQEPHLAGQLSTLICEQRSADPAFPGNCDTRARCTVDGGPVHTPSWLQSEAVVEGASSAEVRQACSTLCGQVSACDGAEDLASAEVFDAEHMSGVTKNHGLCVETCVGHSAANPWRAESLLSGCAASLWAESCANDELIGACAPPLCADKPPQDCLMWAPEDGGNGHVYQWMVEPGVPAPLESWLALIGSDQSTHALAISDGDEMAWVSEVFLGGNIDSTPFIGATYIADEEAWRWSTGELFIASDWAPGEPNLEAGEDVVMSAEGWRIASESTALVIEIAPVIGGDLDRDEVSDLDDNCPEIANGPQRDLDLDGVGDLCDACQNGIIGWRSSEDNDANANGCMDGIEEVESAALDGDGDGFSPNEGDCDDDDSEVFPGAVELCDNLNNDCDSLIDEGFPNADLDGLADCVDPDDDGDGVDDGLDCEPLDPDIFLGKPELCNGVDDDCDLAIDEGYAAPITYYYLDDDADGYGGQSSAPLADCSGQGPPTGYTEDNTDCDDQNTFVYPGAIELCDSFDNDCNGVADDGAAAVDLDGDETPDCLDEDIDGDGFSNDLEVDQGSDPMDPFSCGDQDLDSCDDCSEVGTAQPGNDGLDSDGDGVCDLGDEDDDGDGDPDASDCAQLNPQIYTGAQEICGDLIDDNCDGTLDDGCDLDGDSVEDQLDNCPEVYNEFQVDTDEDGAGDVCDQDDDDDGVSDVVEELQGSDPKDAFSCGDQDLDTCDDCSVVGTAQPDNDGLDTDEDGACDLGDEDDDGDGDPDASDCAQLNPQIFAGQRERCDGVDEDCDTAIDEDFDRPGLDCADDPCLRGPLSCVQGQCVGEVVESPVCGAACTPEARLVSSLSPAGRSPYRSAQVLEKRGYFGTDQGLEIYDTSDPTELRRLGFVATPGPVSALAIGPVGDPSGARAYVAMGAHGLAAIDVRVPEEAQITATMSADPDRPVTDVAIGPGVVIAAAGWHGEGVSGVTVWSYEDPGGLQDLDTQSSFHQLTSDTGADAKIALYAGELAVLNTGTGTVTYFDHAYGEPWSLQNIGEWVSGETSYRDIDLRVFRGSSGEVSERLLFVASEAGPAQLASQEVTISGQAAPLNLSVHVHGEAEGVVATGLRAADTRLFVQTTSGGGLIIDKDWSDELMAEVTSALEGATGVTDAAVWGSVAYITRGEEGLTALKISDPAHAFTTSVQVQSTEGFSPITGLQIVDDHAYITNQQGSFWRTHLSTLFAGAELSAPIESPALELVDSDIGGHERTLISGRDAMTLSLGELRVINTLVTGNHTAIQVSGAHALEVVGNWVYVLRSDGTGVLDVFELRSPEGELSFSAGTPLVFDFSLEGSSAWAPRVMSAEGRYAYVLITSPELGAQGLALVVIDLSDPGAPQQVGEPIPIAFDGYVVDFVVTKPRVHDGVLYVGFGDTITGPEWVTRFDLTHPRLPIPLGLAAELEGTRSSLESSGGYLYGGSIESEPPSIFSYDPDDDSPPAFLAKATPDSGQVLKLIDMSVSGLAFVHVDEVYLLTFKPCSAAVDAHCQLSTLAHYPLEVGVGYKVAASGQRVALLESRDEGVSGLSVFEVSEGGELSTLYRSEDIAGAVLRDLVLDSETLVTGSSQGLGFYEVSDEGVTSIGSASPPMVAFDLHEGELCGALAGGAGIQCFDLDVAGGSYELNLLRVAALSEPVLQLDSSGGPLVATLASGALSFWDHPQDLISPWHPDNPSSVVLDGLVFDDSVYTLWFTDILSGPFAGDKSFSVQAHPADGSNQAVSEVLAEGEELELSVPLSLGEGESASRDYIARYEDWLAVVVQGELSWFSLGAEGLGGWTQVVAELTLPTTESLGLAIEGPRVYIAGGQWPLHVAELGCAPASCAEATLTGPQTRCYQGAVWQVDSCAQPTGQGPVDGGCAADTFCVGCPVGVPICSVEASCVYYDRSGTYTLTETEALEACEGQSFGQEITLRLEVDNEGAVSASFDASGTTPCVDCTCSGLIAAHHLSLTCQDDFAFELTFVEPTSVAGSVSTSVGECEPSWSVEGARTE
ncbi:MAG: MopE-related protein [Myxococcota bacterium]